jgi:hypothetical protein
MDDTAVRLARLQDLVANAQPGDTLTADEERFALLVGDIAEILRTNEHLTEVIGARRAPGRLGSLPYEPGYGALYEAAWDVSYGRKHLGHSALIHCILAAVLPLHEQHLRTRIADGCEKTAGNYPPEVFSPDSDARDAIGGTAMRHAWSAADRMVRDGSLGAAAGSADQDEETLLAATLAPHAVVTTHGGLHWHVTHPAACDRLPYETQCLFDLARELRGYEQEPPAAEMFIGTPYVVHDHGPGDCVRHDCPVLIAWSSAEPEPAAQIAGQGVLPVETAGSAT